MVSSALLLLAAGQPNPFLAPAPAPADNPLKGLVPYQGQGNTGFPHSMEFNYLPLSAVVKGKGRHDWTALEGLLNDIASRGRQTVFRFFLEYPSQPSGIPPHLIAEGLKTTEWQYEKTTTITPDYSDPRLLACLQEFIAALGAKYDGDPRIAFITAGLLGSWGEWHTYPRNDLWASKAVQSAVMDAYEAAFKQTPILLRYPAGDNDSGMAKTVHRRFGYHDDSFAWATLRSAKPDDSWFFLNLMDKAGGASVWKSHPIGGEIRPEAWGIVFDEKPGNPQIQDFAECVRQTRVTWLMDSGMFYGAKSTKERTARAIESVRLMGYQLRVTQASYQRGSGLSFTIRSEGVAPFYQRWPVQAAFLNAKGEPLGDPVNLGPASGILPGEQRVFRERLPWRPQARWAAIRIPNPLPNGRAVGFANKGQDAHAAGWLTLLPVNQPAGADR